MHTTPISGAAVSLKPSPAPSANSSLPDFLLADASGNAGLDFRTIAATLLGLGGSTAGQAIESAKDSSTTKKPVASVPGDDSEDRKDKTLSDPAPILAMHPELTAPIVVAPEAIVQVPSKQQSPKTEGNPNLPGLPPVTTAELASQLQIEDDEIAAKLAGNDRSDSNPARAEKPPTEASLPEATRLNTKTPAPVDADFLNEIPPTKNTLQGASKAATEAATALTLGASGKRSLNLAKAAGDQPQPAGISGALKHDSTSLPNIKVPTPPSDNTVAAVKSELPHPSAAESVPVAPPANQISDASAKGIAESHMAAQAASQAKAINPAAVESRNAAEHTTASELAKVKDRSSASSKDRIGKDRGKDMRAGSTDSGKFAPTQAGRAVAGTTNLSGNSGKDGGMGSPNGSAAQVKQALVKQSPGSSSSPAAAADMDGPDEALPITTSSPITAKFVQGMSGSEFRVGMQSQEFGNIDIRTSVARHMFSAQISVEHNDVAKSLATELPSLYSKLADQHVPVANIVIQGQSLASSSGFAQDAQQQQGWRPQQSHGSASSNVETILPVAVEALDAQGRLDIRI